MNPACSPPPSDLVAGALVLRAIADEDWRLESELSMDADVTRWTFYPESMDEVVARKWVARSEALATQGSAQRYVIWSGQDRLGTCGVTRLMDEVPEIFFVLLPSVRGRGVATEVARALCMWAAGAGRASVALVTVEGNVASEAVAQRAGFVLAATFEGDHRGVPARLSRWIWPDSQLT